MLKIRLQRIGRRNRSAFRIVVIEHTRAPKSGDYIERVGSWDPNSDNVVLLEDKIKYWLSKGAQPTDTVYNLLVKNNIIEGKAKNVLPKKTPIQKEGEQEASEESPEKAETEGETSEQATTEESPANNASEEQTESKEETQEEKTEENTDNPETEAEDKKEE